MGLFANPASARSAAGDINFAQESSESSAVKKRIPNAINRGRRGRDFTLTARGPIDDDARPLQKSSEWPKADGVSGNYSIHSSQISGSADDGISGRRTPTPRPDGGRAVATRRDHRKTMKCRHASCSSLRPMVAQRRRHQDSGSGNHFKYQNMDFSKEVPSYATFVSSPNWWQIFDMGAGSYQKWTFNVWEAESEVWR